MATEILQADTNNELFACLAAIESLAQLLQKAHERMGDTTGVFGTALVIEQKAHEAIALIGQD
ncbi:MAG: hypothetical protein M3R16_12210 [Pseudomonadota bacterium]|nr:hypothetical protein [Pseudomonadota bacterium]